MQKKSLMILTRRDDINYLIEILFDIEQPFHSQIAQSVIAQVGTWDLQDFKI